jgi:hypothetical protein
VTQNTYVTRRDVRGESGRELPSVEVREAHRRVGTTRVGGAPLSDLEPARARAAPRRSSRAGRDLAEVNRGRAEVVDGVVELEADGRAGGDGHGGSRGGVGVADVVRRGRGGDRAVVHGLADSRGGGGGASDEGVPDVCNKVSLKAVRSCTNYVQCAETDWARAARARRPANFIVVGELGMVVGALERSLGATGEREPFPHSLLYPLRGEMYQRPVASGEAILALYLRQMCSRAWSSCDRQDPKASYPRQT